MELYYRFMEALNEHINFPIVVYFVLIRTALIWGLLLYIAYLLIRALRKYLGDGKQSPERTEIKRSLGEALKVQRQRNRMTQEFVAESLGVSRQAVSKWENGTSDPSTSNLFALAKLYGISVEELLRDVASR